MYNNGQSSSLMPVEVQSSTSKSDNMDEKLIQCLNSKNNSPFDLPLTVGVAGKPKPDAFKGVNIMG